jgi:hypothetical protein
VADVDPFRPLHDAIDRELEELRAAEAARAERSSRPVTTVEGLRRGERGPFVHPLAWTPVDEGLPAQPHPPAPVQVLVSRAVGSSVPCALQGEFDAGRFYCHLPGGRGRSMVSFVTHWAHVPPPAGTLR